MIVFKMSVVLSLTLVTAYAMRSASAAARHRVLAVGLAGAALVPLLVRIAPAWGAALLPAPTFLEYHGSSLSLLRLWSAGTAFLLAYLALGAARLAWIRSRSSCPGPSLVAETVNEMSRELGVGRCVRLLECDRDVMPATSGVLRPCILLPSASRRWTADRLRAVVGHELAHIRRGDWLVYVMAELIACAYWWHPLVRLVRSRVHAEAERACDDLVLNAGVLDTEYASHLIAVARELRSRRLSSMVPAIAGGCGLQSRVRAALDHEMNRIPLSTAATTVLVVAMSALTLAAAGFGQPPERPAAPSSVSAVQRDIMRSLSSLDERLSLVAPEVTFRRDRIEGRVELHARLGVDGWPVGVTVVPPVHPDLASAAAVILRQWHREPARLRGVPVEVPMRVTIDFRSAE